MSYQYEEIKVTTSMLNACDLPDGEYLMLPEIPRALQTIIDYDSVFSGSIPQTLKIQDDEYVETTKHTCTTKNTPTTI